MHAAVKHTYRDHVCACSMKWRVNPVTVSLHNRSRVELLFFHTCSRTLRRRAYLLAVHSVGTFSSNFCIITKKKKKLFASVFAPQDCLYITFLFCQLALPAFSFPSCQKCKCSLRYYPNLPWNLSSLMRLIPLWLCSISSTSLCPLQCQFFGVNLKGKLQRKLTEKSLH